MPTRAMPLPWSNNNLALHPRQLVTNYRFRCSPNCALCDFPDYSFRAADHTELADVLQKDGNCDGTVQVEWEHNGSTARYESLYGMAAEFRTKLQRADLNIPQHQLRTLFTKSGRGLRPDVLQWWADTLSSTSRPWRLRRYVMLGRTRQARRIVEEFLEFGSETDMIAFKLRWPELWY
jgi:hypothetical protein